MNGLALCSGIFGIEIGLTRAIPGYRTVCAVEREAYCAAVLVARQKEGSLPQFPIWDDVTTFDGKPCRGVVDIITGGIPCQPWSVAGQKKGTKDERWIWADMSRILESRPDLAPAVSIQEEAQSEVRMLANGVPRRMAGSTRVDKLRCLGNAVVPACTGKAFLVLLEKVAHGKS